MSTPSPVTQAKHLLDAARLLKLDIGRLRLCVPRSESESLDLYDTLVGDSELRATTESLYRSGHYAQAVEEAFKFVNNLVKEKTGLTNDGADLMRKAFSVNGPRLRLGALRTQSQRDRQQGYMDIFAGCMTGIRNPRAHEHMYSDDPDVALRKLMWADHLVRLVKASTRTRRRRA